MKSFFRRQKPSSLRERGRSKVRWTIWEITGLMLSVIMMASPLLAAGYSVIFPTDIQGQPRPTDDPNATATSNLPTNTVPTVAYPPATNAPTADPCFVPTVYPTLGPTDIPTLTAITTPTAAISGTVAPPSTALPTATNIPTATAVLPSTALPTATETPSATVALPATSLPTLTATQMPTATVPISRPGGLGSSVRLQRPLLQAATPCVSPTPVTPTATVGNAVTNTPTITPTNTIPVIPNTPTTDPCATAIAPTTGTTALPTNTATQAAATVYPTAITGTPGVPPSATIYPTDIPRPGGASARSLLRPLLQGSPCTPTTQPTTAVPATTGPTSTVAAAQPIVVSKVSTASQVDPGDEFTFVVTVAFRDNGDGATQRNVVIRDTLPVGLTFVSVTFFGAAVCNAANPIECSGTVSANNPIVLNIRVRVNATVTPGTSITNLATVTVNGATISDDDTVFVRLPQPTAIAPTVPTAIAPTVPTAIATTRPTSIVPTTVVSTPRPGQPSNTPRPGQPGNTPRPGQPTQEPTSRPGNTAVPATSIPGQPATIAPPRATAVAPNPPATARPGAPNPPATARPGVPQPPATARPVAPRTAVPGQSTQQPRATVAAGATSTNVPPTAAGIVVQPVSGLQFQKKSDWGSRFAGESLMYTITVISPTGTLATGGLRDVVVTDQVPTNLEVNGPIKVSDQNARVEQQGNQITVRVGTLPAGQTLTIMIPVKIKGDVAAQTRIVNQAQMRYNGITDPIYSNVASVLVVGSPPPLTATALAVVAQDIATPNPATVTAGSGVPGGVAGAATATAVAGGGNFGTANPPTSAGIPILGFVLFGLTLLVRNIRVRRELTRI